MSSGKQSHALMRAINIVPTNPHLSGHFCQIFRKLRRGFCEEHLFLVLPKYLNKSTFYANESLLIGKEKLSLQLDPTT